MLLALENSVQTAYKSQISLLINNAPC